MEDGRGFFCDIDAAWSFFPISLPQSLHDPVAGLLVAWAESVDEKDAVFLRELEEGTQELDGAGVPPMEVLDADDHRPEFRSFYQQLADVLEDELLQRLAL